MDLPNPGIKPRSPTLQVDSLLAEPQEKPKNTGVSSLSLLQGIFQTQELNQGLLHCRQIPLIAQLVKNPPAKGGDSTTCFHQPLRVSKCGCRWMQQASKLSAAPELADLAQALCLHSPGGWAGATHGSSREATLYSV